MKCLLIQQKLSTALHDVVYSNHQVSEMLSIPRPSVVPIVHRYQEFDTVENILRSGRSRVFSEREDRCLVQYGRRHRTASASALRNHYQGTFHRVISIPTVQRRIHHANLRARRPLQVFSLLSRYPAARFQ